MRTFTALFSSLCAALALAAPIEEIVVTADYRGRALGDAVGSFSVQSASMIAARGATHLEEILGSFANLNYASGGSRARFFQLRGIGERAQFIEPLNPSVGVLVDALDFTGLGSAPVMFDTRQVEVLRGPQGTRFGASALAGLIQIRSNDATSTPEVRARLGWGTYGRQSLEGAVSGALGKTLRGRLALMRQRENGFVRNSYLRRSDTNNRDESGQRIRLHWLPEDGLDVHLWLLRLSQNNGYDAFSLDNNRETRSDQPGGDRLRARAESLRVQKVLPLAHWEVIYSHLNASQDYYYDEDWAWSGFHLSGYASTDRYQRTRTHNHLEMRLLSRPGSGLFNQRLHWFIGIYRMRRAVLLRRDYTYLSNRFLSENQSVTRALFGQLDWDISSNLAFALGLRYERRDVAYSDNNGIRNNPDESLTTGKISAAWDVREGFQTYLLIARGLRPGGINADATLPEHLRTFRSESLRNLELGVRMVWEQPQLQLQLAIFDMARTSAQIRASFQVQRTDGSTTFPEFTDNATDGNNRGLELTLDWQPAEDWSLYSALGILDTSFSNYAASAQLPLGSRDQAHAPPLQVFVRGRRIIGDWSISMQVEYKDRFHFSNSHNSTSDAYSLLHVSARWQREQFQVRFWVRNLADAAYPVRGFYFGNDPRIGYAPTSYTQLGEPRHLGMDLHWQR